VLLADRAKRHFVSLVDLSQTRRNGSVRNFGMSDFSNNDPKMPQELTAQVDAWAEAQGLARSDAICRLVELGLSTARLAISSDLPRRAPSEIEQLAEKQIDKLLDPKLPTSERERRIRRLTEGPPEFSDKRIDLAKRRE
jgi:hypothetical protein